VWVTHDEHVSQCMGVGEEVKVGINWKSQEFRKPGTLGKYFSFEKDAGVEGRGHRRGRSRFLRGKGRGRYDRGSKTLVWGIGSSR